MLVRGIEEDKIKIKINIASLDNLVDKLRGIKPKRVIK